MGSWLGASLRGFLLVTGLATLPAATSLAADGASGEPANRIIGSLQDLDGLRIAVLQGSAQEAFARKTYPSATVLAFSAGVTDINLALTTGKAIPFSGSRLAGDTAAGAVSVNDSWFSAS